MKIEGVAIRPGHVLEYKGSLWVVRKTQHVKLGKGKACNQVEMKDIVEGTKMNVRFSSDEKVERARLEQKEYQFLYEDGDDLHFMNSEDFEQVALPAELLGEQKPFLQENMMVTVESHNGRAISISLPEQVTLEVAQADPVVKGQTAAASYKPALLENDVRIMVPPFVEAGDRVVVHTASSEYVKRAE